MRAFLPFLAALPLAALAASPALQNAPEAARLYDLSTREAQHRALMTMPKIQVQYARFGRVQVVEGSTALFMHSLSRLRPGDSADIVMRQLAPLLMASQSDGLRVKDVEDRN